MFLHQTEKILHKRRFVLSTVIAIVTGIVGVSILIGGLVTILYRRRERYKLRIIANLVSADRRVVQRSIRRAQRMGMLKDRSLYRANLVGAHWFNIHALAGAELPAVRLAYADLAQTNLTGVNLTDANLWMADLTQTNLQLANLTRAQMINTRLQQASLVCANLSQANLWMSNFYGADLTNTSLKKAILTGAYFDKNTILPDGSKWTPDVDLERFTDPRHPSFWHSNNPESPAYPDNEHDQVLWQNS